MSEPDSMQRVFWGWQQPVLEAAVAFLTKGCSSEGALDLADSVILVPTSEAGRRLRRELALWADARGGAVSVPHVWPPQVALFAAEDQTQTASEIEVMLAWMRAITTAPPASLKALLPRLPEVIHWSWTKGLALTLTDLQNTLTAGGMSMPDVAGSPVAMPENERARWQDLARLESIFEAELKRRGKISPARSKRHRARQPRLPEGVTRVLVLAAPDLPPLLNDWLHACADSGIKVTVAVQAPVELTDGFDPFGRPLPETWGEESDLTLPLSDGDLHCCHDATSQVETLVSHMRQDAASGLSLAVGICDPELTPLLKERLQLEGLAVFEPDGLPAQQDGLWHLLSWTVDLIASKSWSTLAALARIKEVRQAWGFGSGPDLIRELDVFAAKHLPVDLELAAELLAELPDYPQVRQAVGAALKWRQRFLDEPLPDIAQAWLIALQGERLFNTARSADNERAQLAWAWLEEAGQVAAAEQAFPTAADRAQLWSLALERLSARKLGVTRGDIDLVLQGWLELLWEPAPALLVAGMNEEFVPGILGSHAFLPDSLRQRLGLPCQSTRFARDAYLLRALAESRLAHGRLTLLCGRWSQQGEARKPSRLLMLCAEAALPERVTLLFPQETEQAAATVPPRTLAWTLQPETRPPRLTSISASRLNAYLRCPYRFYLSDVLRMREIAPPEREMDALGFGEALHEVLRWFGEDTEARALTDEQSIASWFKDRLEYWTRQRFGRRPPPLVRLQMQAALARLEAHAGIEALSRADGWEIEAVELDLGDENDPTSLLIDGVPFKCKIDRIERNRRTGQRRLIDFKTSESAVEPKVAHCKKPPRHLPDGQEWRVFTPPGSDKTLFWTNLQLPLYAAALQHRDGTPVDFVGYGCLPKAVMDVKLGLWEDFDESWEEAALACAAEAVRRIRAGIFWPPDERVTGELDHLFLGDPASTAMPPGAQVA